MHSLEPELRELQAAQALPAEVIARAIALENRSLFTLFQELRAALYVAVTMIVTGVGMVVKNNLERIGPLTIVLILLALAAACYFSAWRTYRAGRERSTGGDYVLLLGALLFSTAVGYGEAQFRWLGAYWSLHLLLLALWHAASAYLFNSRLVLSVALASLATWFGIEAGPRELFYWNAGAGESGLRALSCAALLLGWRTLHVRLDWHALFPRVFEHFAANLAFWGAFTWCWSASTRLPGLLTALALGVVTVRWGLRQREELFVAYGVAYAALACCVALSVWVNSMLLSALVVLLLVVGAAGLLWQLHQRLKQAAP